MMFEILALVGGFGFFLFALAILVLGIISCEWDSPIGAVITFAVMLVGGYWFFGLPVFESMMNNVLLTTMLAITYVVAGFVYAVFWRYGRWLNDNSEGIQDSFIDWSDRKQKIARGDRTLKSELRPDQNQDDNIEDIEVSWNDPSVKTEFMESNNFYRYTPKNNKDKIFSWMALWPWGLIWELTNRPIRWVYNTMYDFAAKFLEKTLFRITDRILGGK